ncbi:MAG: HypC/HybG/HupF family hydrogenase formation chaperone [Ignavibacteriales bacterium]|nr:HypC/HybG/HupF family hydrogenase formation chaperone [Ignavibacteriales bacterium]
MNLVSGELVEIYIEGGTTMGKVRVNGAFVRAPLTFLMEAKVGDKILMESGVAISKVETENLQEH